MIKDLVQYGRSAADRLILRDALNSHYESLIAPMAAMSPMTSAFSRTHWFGSTTSSRLWLSSQFSGRARTPNIWQRFRSGHTPSMPQAGKSCVVRSLKSTNGVRRLPARLRWHWPSMLPNVAWARHRIDQRNHGRCTTPKASRNRAISVYSSLFASGSEETAGQRSLVGEAASCRAISIPRTRTTDRASTSKIPRAPLGSPVSPANTSVVDRAVRHRQSAAIRSVAAVITVDSSPAAFDEGRQILLAAPIVAAG